MRFALAVALLLAGCAMPVASPPENEPTQAIPGVAVERLAWTSITDGPTPRTEVVVGLLGSRIYVIGGFPQPPVALPTTVPTSLVEVYDVEADAWSRGPEYPLQVHHSAAVELDGSLYVLGGLTGPAFLPTPLAFRLEEGGAAWTPIAPLPEARGSHAAAVLDGIIYVAAGEGAQGHLADVLAYDPTADAWTSVGAPLPTLRDHTAGGAVGGRFCLAGGDTGGHGENTDATECFDPATGEWSTHAPVPTLRGSVAAAVWHERLVILGGQNATQTFDAAEAFDLANDTWITLPPLAQARHGFGAVALDQILYAVYGGPDPGLTTTSSVEVLR